MLSNQTMTNNPNPKDILLALLLQHGFQLAQFTNSLQCSLSLWQLHPLLSL